MVSLLRAYNRVLERQPLATNMLTAACFSGLGDCMAQRLEKLFGVQSTGKTGYNYERSGRMMLWGLCAGNMCAHWYRWLDRAARGLKLSSPGRDVGFRVFADQMLFQPLIINTFFTVTSLLEGKSLPETKAKLQNKSLTSWLMCVPYWSAIQLVNFRYVVPLYQPIVVYAGCLGYNTAMSVISHAHEYGTETERALQSALDQSRVELTEMRKELRQCHQDLRAAHDLIQDIEHDVPGARQQMHAFSELDQRKQALEYIDCTTTIST